MENDIQLERKYFAYCLIKKSKQKDHNIPINNYVRVVLSKDAKFLVNVIKFQKEMVRII